MEAREHRHMVFSLDLPKGVSYPVSYKADYK